MLPSATARCPTTAWDSCGSSSSSRIRSASIRSGRPRRDRCADGRVPLAGGVLRALAGRRRRSDCRGVLPEAGRGAHVGLQDERVREPARRIGFRAARRQSDARLPRRGALCASGVCGRLCPRVRGDEARARRHGAAQRHPDDPILPPRRRRRARRRADGGAGAAPRRERVAGLRHVRDPEQRAADRCFRAGLRRFLDRVERFGAARPRRRSRLGAAGFRLRRARPRGARDDPAGDRGREAERPLRRDLRSGAVGLS